MFRKGPNLLVVIVLLMAGLFFNAPAFAEKHPDLQVPARLRPRVNFWIDVFGRYTKAQVIIHHRRFPQIRFAVLDVEDATRGMNDVQFDSYKDRALKAKLKEVREDIALLATGQEPRTQQQRRIEQIMEALGPGPDKYQKIIEDPDLVRGQSGIREKMADAIRRSGRYLPIMEGIFVNEFDLPAELTRLPFVESSFDYRAYSTVAAAGIWQFMPKTARTYMRVSSVVDERLDPIESSRAAARYLKSAYARLGTWPLALTSYNHGVAGVLNKVRKFGTADISSLIENGSAEPPFGFASANFFPSYLAAKEVFDRRAEFFPGLIRDPGLDLVTVRLSRPYNVSEIKKQIGISEQALQSANYALSDSIWQGRVNLPAGYNLKVPAEFEAKVIKAGFGSSAESLSTAGAADEQPSEKPALKASPKEPPATQVQIKTEPPAQTNSYKVRAGDTLHSIAREYGISAEALQQENKLKNSFVYVGKVLKIPQEKPAPAAEKKSAKGGSVTLYTVKKGDSISSVSKKYRIPTDKIIALNGLSAKKPAIKVGQTIKLPR